VPAHPGEFSVPFDFNASFFGAPASEFPPIDNGCFDPGVTCQMLGFSGSGTAVFDVAPFPGLPGQFQINRAIFTFSAPEPSTFWLLVLGFAGLATARGRRLFGI
jgi:hypothetical protein